ncbi:YfbM family protein [Chitinimonas taiwanensis]|uniref:YfbM protein n=1 Tax=Chitinimonas taiwanensis DSM 18899 TaxID=1121279 RepID=A0A1K2H4I6_9NEIS|nr:YfbM family protein [Chitinimonas taiwanensis]SFZ70774.1 protein of unknown function [Chitinimonas taiwanensis DSM 18899]
MSMIGNFLAVPQEELSALFDTPENIGSTLYEKHSDNVVDLDKAWHAIHFVLTGEQYGGAPPLANAVFGEAPIGEEDVGYGPALGTQAESVKQIAEAICAIEENDFRKRIDIPALSEAEIYPSIWDEGPEAADYITDYFKELQSFYKDAAQNNMAVITFIN